MPRCEYVPDRPLSPPEDDRPVVYECNDCSEPIRADDPYFVFGGNTYCESCTEEAFHYAAYDEDEEHYKCADCEKVIDDDEGYYTVKGKIYCEKCGDSSRSYAENWEEYAYAEEF